MLYEEQQRDSIILGYRREVSKGNIMYHEEECAWLLRVYFQRGERGPGTIFISPDEGGPPDTVNSYREGPFPEDKLSESAMNHNYIVLGKSRG